MWTTCLWRLVLWAWHGASRCDTVLFRLDKCVCIKGGGGCVRVCWYRVASVFNTVVCAALMCLCACFADNAAYLGHVPV